MNYPISYYTNLNVFEFDNTCICKYLKISKLNLYNYKHACLDNFDQFRRIN